MTLAAWVTEALADPLLMVCPVEGKTCNAFAEALPIVIATPMETVEIGGNRMASLAVPNG